MRLFAPDDLSLGEPVFAPIGDAVARNEIVALLRSHWAGLGPVTAQQVGVALRGAALRRNFLVSMGGERYVLKAVQGPLAAERLAEELALERHLRAHGVPVVRSVLTDSGAAFVARGNVAWVLHSFVAGRHFTGAGFELEAAATTFARLVHACASLPAGFGASARKTGARVAAFIEAPTVGQRLAPHRETLFELVTATDHLKPLTELDDAIVHVDFHPANLIMGVKGVTCVLDLEDVVPYPVLPALGFAAFKLIRQMLVDDAVRATERAEPTLVARWLDCWHGQVPFPLRTAGELRAGAEYRVLALIDLILDQQPGPDDHPLLYELDKQIRSLYEIQEIFGARAQLGG